MAKQLVIDPWLEGDEFTRVDFSIRPEDALDPDDPSLDIHPGLDPEVVVAEGGVIVPVSQPVVEPEPEAPEVYQTDDGTITLEKEKGQWKVTLASNSGGQPQVYWGKTKNELIVHAMAKAQFNATAKIRELNAKLKLGGTPNPKPTPITQPTSRSLSVEEVFEIKTQLDSDPGLAFDTYFQKRTGLTLDQLVGFAKKGANADASLETEAVGKDFMARNSDYYAHPQNLQRLIQWLGKFKLGNPSADMNELYTSGVWIVENLEEAFQDLTTDGLLVKPKPATQTVVEPQPRTEERIVRTETRPRAALGLRPTDVAPTPTVEAPKAPSVEDLDSLSDDAIAKLMSGVKRHKILSRRS